MTARILSFPGAIPHQPAARLRLVEDDFAAKVTAESDKRFWIRVERDCGDAIVVSDFIRGELAERELIAGLRLALRALDLSGRNEIRFRDIVPGGISKPLFGLRLEQITECVKRASSAVAADSGRKVAAFSIRPQGDKMDAVARFG